MRSFIPASPPVALLGIEIDALGDDDATLRLPYRPELTTACWCLAHAAAAATYQIS
jgi:acyl-coenzyme A thioesterase PaaI-like protein